MKPTPWGKKAKSLLRNRDCFPCLFEDQPLAEEGQRNSTLLKYIGQVISLLYPGLNRGLAGTTRKHIFALFLDPCLALGREQDGTPYDEVAWDMIVRLWAEEEALEETLAAKAMQQAAHTEKISDSILKGVREWLDLPQEDSEALRWLEERLIVSWGNHVFVMKPNGYYDSIAVTHAQLHARIRELGMDTIISLDTIKATGGFRRVTAQELIDRHATIVGSVEGVVSEKGGTLRDIGTQHSTLSIGMYGRRSEIEPEWSDEVDNWLQRLCSTQETYDNLNTWIAHSLAFEDGPICALSLTGPPGCGKKMLAWGLAECITTQTVASDQDFGDYASQLLKSPFLVINEGFPKLTNTKDAADTFRAFTSGDPISVNRKFQDIMMIRSPLRVMIFANNLSVLQTLTAHRDLSPDDRDALAQRLLHIQAAPDSSEWLRSMGGLQYTGQLGNRWIRGDDGSASDSVIAKHFMYLYSHRPSVPLANRLLVEGDRAADVIRILSTQSGKAPEVIEVLIHMIQQKIEPQGLAVVERNVFVTASAIVDHHRTHFHKTSGITLTVRSTVSVLKGLMAPNWDPNRIQVIKSGNGKIKNRGKWWKLRADTLYREAMDCGYPCQRLENIVNPITEEIVPDGI